MDRICDNCNGPIDRTDPKARFCSRACSEAFHGARLRERLYGHRQPGDCEHCGQPIVARKVPLKSHYCSNNCAQAARSARDRRATIANRPPRVCALCGVPIAADAHGRIRFCSDVCRARYHVRRGIERKHRRVEARKAGRGPCPHCGKPIPLYLRSDAIYCSAECRDAARYPGLKATASDRTREYLYGITPEEFAVMVDRQGGRCAICGTDTPGGKGNWHIDHDHITGVVRSLLCHACNVGLGNFNDNPDQLRAAIAYLEAHRDTRA